MNNIFFDSQTIYKGVFNVTYRNLRALRCPFDYVMYQMIINEVEPDLIIEIGTNHGGGALYMADLLNIINKPAIVHTIDIQSMVTDKQVLTHPRIKLFLGGYQNYDISIAKNYKKIIIIDDGSHVYNDVINALNKFSPLVNIGSYYIIEDGILTELNLPGYNGGPLHAIEDFLKNNNDFIIDKKWCNFFGNNATFNVNGYLKRVK